MGTYLDPDSIHAVILGVVQGLTEFLPVSSSGHLEIGKVLLGSDLAAADSMTMTVVLHAATALSTIAVFHRDVGTILRGLCQRKWNAEWQFASRIVISMVPAVVVGLTLNDLIESLFTGNMLLVGAMLTVTGLLLLLAGKSKPTEKHVSGWDAFVVGLAQAFAILPGVSRSGATISTSVLQGVDRMQAARFSFLMVVPLILGKMTQDILSGEASLRGADSLPLVLGFVAAFVTGVVACKWMISLVKNCQLWWFSVYCFVVGCAAMGYGFAS